MDLCQWVLLPVGRLKNLRDMDKWSFLRSCLSVRVISVTRELELYWCRQDGSNSIFQSYSKRRHCAEYNNIIVKFPDGLGKCAISWEKITSD